MNYSLWSPSQDAELQSQALRRELNARDIVPPSATTPVGFANSPYVGRLSRAVCSDVLKALTQEVESIKKIIDSSSCCRNVLEGLIETISATACTYGASASQHVPHVVSPTGAYFNEEEEGEEEEYDEEEVKVKGAEEEVVDEGTNGSPSFYDRCVNHA